MAAYEAAGETDEWYTPAYIFAALGERFDLDVAADRWYSSLSLILPWEGFVWMNPPFGNQSTKRDWLGKFFMHGDGVALLPDRTSAPWWQESASQASVILLVSPRVKFERPDGSIGDKPGTGTTLMAAGERGTAALLRAKSLGMTFRAV